VAADFNSNTLDTHTTVGSLTWMYTGAKMIILTEYSQLSSFKRNTAIWGIDEDIERREKEKDRI
jgi:hypothetical protein